MKLINIGCGMSPTPGWENFDNSPSVKLAAFPALAYLLFRLSLIDKKSFDYIDFCRQNSVKWADAKKKIPLDDNSVDVLYSSHMLEHLDRTEARSFLNEAKRVLRPGGILRIVVPDLGKAIEEYCRNRDADRFLETTLLCSENPKTLFEKFKIARIGNRHHLWMYDQNSLVQFLERNEFKNVRPIAAGETNIVSPGSLDLYERRAESIYVEAVN